MSRRINIRKSLTSFRYAWAGIFSLFKYENNAKIHLIAAFLVILAGILLHITPTELAFLVLAIGLVWAAEAFNTAIEKLADLVSPDYHPVIKVVKDLAAAAVLILTVASIVVGLIVFLPYVVNMNLPHYP